MVRWLSIAVITYMIAGIIWWGLLLHKKNQELYDQRLASALPQQLEELAQERSRQNLMIIGEGIVLGCSLLLGIYIINRSAQKELQSATQQNNFLLSVSHELKSPIAAIKLALQTMGRKGVAEDKKGQFITSAIEDTNRLEKLVQNILLSANMEAQSFELLKSPANIDALINEVIDKLPNGSSESIDIQNPNHQVEAHIDVDYFKQAVTNLLENALKYGDPSSRVKISLLNKEEQVTIDITSSGSPISKSDREKIFQKFYRVRSDEVRAKEGTGLGLYIANEIIKAHQGIIELATTKDTNTFQIKIPAHV